MKKNEKELKKDNHSNSNLRTNSSLNTKLVNEKHKNNCKRFKRNPLN